MERERDGDPVLRTLTEQENIIVRARAGDAHIAVTDRRLVVASLEREMLDVPIEGLRRVQFDIERHRPATLVLVPEEPSHEPQVLAVPPEEYSAVAEALVILGRRFAELPQ